MKVKATCCCGTSIDISAWFRDVEIPEELWGLHARCAVAWQREHGVHTTLKRKDIQEDDA